MSHHHLLSMYRSSLSTAITVLPANTALTHFTSNQRQESKKADLTELLHFLCIPWTLLARDEISYATCLIAYHSLPLSKGFL